MDFFLCYDIVTLIIIIGIWKKINLENFYSMRRLLWQLIVLFLLWEQKNKSPAINVEVTSIYF